MLCLSAKKQQVAHPSVDRCLHLVSQSIGPSYTMLEMMTSVSEMTALNPFHFFSVICLLFIQHFLAVVCSCLHLCVYYYPGAF